MRIVFAASTAVTVGLIASGALGIASAETTTSTTTTTPALTPPVAPLRTVAVQGVATEAIEQSASAATATGVYRQGMADAVNDGQAKAQFLAGKGGATLGPVQSMVEDGGSIGCAAELEYLGEQPDFGYVSGNRVTAVAPESARALSGRKVLAKPRKKRPSAKKASAGGCTLSAQVTLVYSIG